DEKNINQAIILYLEVYSLKILVTGGAGFIGSNLCGRLLGEGHEVLCVDNLLTGSIENIKEFCDHTDFTFLEHDVTQPFLAQVEAIFHLASPASPVGYMNHPIETILVNTQGTYQMLEMARQQQARFLVSSTSEVYGDPLIHPQTEDYWGNVNPIGPRACYDEAKRFAEAMTMAYRNEHGIETRIVRIFNTYGPRMRLNDGRVVPAFVSQALKNQPITVFGDGRQTRSFCYVSDLIEGIYRLMMGSHNEPVNIGNPREMTMLDFAQEIIRATGSRSKLVFKPLPQDDPKQRRPDITRARTWLKWEPQVPLARGLKKTIAYFQTRVQEG